MQVRKNRGGCGGGGGGGRDIGGDICKTKGLNSSLD